MKGTYFMNKISRSALGLVGAGVMALGTVAVVAPAATAAPAHPSASCYASGCHGLDPYYDTDCWRDAAAVDFLDGPTGELTLYYSGNCHANWATLDYSYSGAWVEVENAYGDYQGYTLDRESSGYTYMVDGSVDARASDADGYTGWH